MRLRESKTRRPTVTAVMAALGSLFVGLFVALTTGPLIVRPDPMLVLELIVAAPMMAVAAVALVAVVAQARAWRSATAWSVAAAIGLIGLGGVLVVSSRNSWGAFRAHGAAPWLADAVPWVVLASGLLLAGAIAASSRDTMSA